MNEPRYPQFEVDMTPAYQKLESDRKSLDQERQRVAQAEIDRAAAEKTPEPDKTV